MSLEATLERIASALETMAKNSTANSQELKTTLASLDNPGYPVGEGPGTVVAAETVLAAETVAAPQAPVAVAGGRPRKPKTEAAPEASVPAAPLAPPAPAPADAAPAPASDIAFDDVRAAAIAYGTVGSREALIGIFESISGATQVPGINSLKVLADKPETWAVAIDVFTKATAAAKNA